MIRLAMASAVVLGLSAASFADTVNLDFTGGGAGRSVQLNFQSGGYHSLFAGQMQHTMSAGTGVGSAWSGSQNLFCAELVQSTGPGSPTFTIESVSNLPDPGAGYGTVKQQAVWDLYSHAGANATSGAATNDYACAFQLMVWEILYDYNGTAGSISLTAGNLKANSLTSQAQTYFTTFASYIDGAGNGAGVYGLGNTSYQDQIFYNPVAVPLPAGALMGAAGLGIVGFIRRKRA